MESHSRDLEIVAELEAMRPRPRPAFAAELDARAAAFPDRLSPRRLAIPAGALALVAIAAATAVISISEPGTNGTRSLLERPAGTSRSGPEPGHHTTQFESGPPVAPSSAGGAEVQSQSAVGHDSARIGPYAARVRDRDVERSARIVLAVDPDEVRSAAADVFSTVHSYEGIVLHSSTRSGGGGAVASFDLLIPSGRLDDAMSSLSQIGTVSSRSDGSVDVTAPTVGLQERVRDSRAKIESLLAELAAAETDGERESVEAELRSERNRLTRLRAHLTALERRTHFARVAVRIDSDHANGAGAGGSWGIDDALGDAGRILAVAAGVTVISAAILAPLALVLILALAVQRAWLRRSRERVLDRAPATGSE